MDTRGLLPMKLAIPTLIACAILTGCGGGGGGGGVAPTVAFDASSAIVSAGGFATLTWSSTDAASCAASQGWTGSRATSGTERVGPLNAITSFVLTCTGNGSAAKTVTVIPLLIQTDTAKTAPLETVTLALNTPMTEASGKTPDFTLQLDTSGLATFVGANVLEIPGLFADGKISFAGPILEPYRSIGAATIQYAVRAKHNSDGLFSNAINITYVPLTIPAGKKGLAKTTLELVLKLAMQQQGSNAEAASRSPGFLSDSMIKLGAPIAVSDIEAEAILQQVFATSSVSLAASSQATIMAIHVRPAFITDRLRSGVNGVMKCISDGFAAVSSFESSAQACEFDDAAEIVKTEIVGGITDAMQQFGQIGSTLGAILPSRMLAGPIAQLAESAASAELVGDVAQVALHVPGVTSTPQQARDWATGRLTDLGKRKLYDYMVKDVGDVQQQMLELVGTPELIDPALSRAGSAALSIYNGVVDRAAQAADVVRALKGDSATYGGPPTSGKPPAEMPLLGSTVAIDQNAATPAQLCTSMPSLGPALAEMGFSSCEAYVTPFFDPKFLNSVIMPILNSISFDQLEACLATPDTPACERLLDNFTQQVEALFDKIRDYQDGTFNCDSGYTSLPGRSSNARTCVFGSLIASSPPPACFAGSRVPKWASACVYYSRDFIQTGSAKCRPNYSLVPFLGTNRCRWTAIPLSRPAVYALNVETGETEPIEQ